MSNAKKVINEEFIQNLEDLKPHFSEEYEKEYADDYLEVLSEEAFADEYPDETIDAAGAGKEGNFRPIKTVKSFVSKLLEKISVEKSAKRIKTVEEMINKAEKLNMEYTLEIEELAKNGKNLNQEVNAGKREKIEKHVKEAIKVLGLSKKDAAKKGIDGKMYDHLMKRLNQVTAVLDIDTIIDKAWDIDLENFSEKEIKFAIEKNKLLQPNSTLQKRNFSILKSIRDANHFNIPDTEFMTEHELALEKMKRGKNELLTNTTKLMGEMSETSKKNEKLIKKYQEMIAKLKKENKNMAKKIDDLQNARNPKEGENFKKVENDKKSTESKPSINPVIQNEINKKLQNIIGKIKNLNKKDEYNALMQIANDIQNIRKKFQNTREFQKVANYFDFYEKFVNNRLNKMELNKQSALDQEKSVKDIYKQKYESCLQIIKNTESMGSDYEGYVKASLFVKLYDDHANMPISKEEFDAKYASAISVFEKNFREVEPVPPRREEETIPPAPIVRMPIDENYVDLQKAVEKAKNTHTMKDVNIAREKLNTYSGYESVDSFANELEEVVKGDVTAGYTKEEITENFLNHIDEKIETAYTQEALEEAKMILNNNRSQVSEQEYTSRMRQIEAILDCYGLTEDTVKPGKTR